MLLQMTLFHSFLCLSSIPLYVCIWVCVYVYLFYPLSVDGHTGYFCVLAIMNSVAMHIRVIILFEL